MQQVMHALCSTASTSLHVSLCCCRPFIGQGNSSKREGAKKGTKKGDQTAAGSGAGAAAAAGAAALAELGELAGGMKQKDQQRVLQEYRDGGFNVLLATCIGEEGLDIPQVCDAQ
jgi:ERCC4-related helicase